MGLSIWLYPFLFFILQFQTAYCSTKPFSFSPTLPYPHNNNFKCPYEQSLALLQLKQDFSIPSSAASAYASFICEYSGQPSKPKTMSWNMSVDCCKWEGVTCDVFTGDVIGLDLSCSQLKGTIHSNSTLFNLSHLKRLNLALNEFSPSAISHQFGRFPSLTHLNLSGNVFEGDVPSEILHLSNLVSLDLSRTNFLKFETNSFEILLRNLTQLSELSLSTVDLSSAIFPINMSSSLTLLDLSQTGLRGTFPNQLLHLPNLQILILSFNPSLTGSLSNAANVSSMSPLRELDLTACNFFGTLPESLGNLTQITRLSLIDNKFSGNLNPNLFAKLQHLSRLVLKLNDFSGPFPSSIGNSTQLVHLDLSSNSLSGAIPSSIGDLTQIVHLDLSKNSLSGAIPFSIGNLTQLDSLYLYFNSLTGSIPFPIYKLTQLSILDLSNNILTDPLPSNAVGLQYLRLESNQLSGPIEDLRNQSLLSEISLGDNHLYGQIPHSLSTLANLRILDLSRNNLTGIIKLNMFSNRMFLKVLDLSYNNLTVRSTSINPSNAIFPSLMVLRLSSCKVKEIPIINHIQVLDLRHNILQGPLPINICDFTNLQVLDLSHNNLSGEILPCLGNFSDALSVLNLQNNNFQGTIPTTFAEGNNNFRNINFNGNQLVGKLQHSLANCKQLEVLDLGNNYLNDTFPAWLETLPGLKVLVLKSNRFHGSIPDTTKTQSPFSNLRIIDLSNNEFSGLLPSKYFTNFNAMMKVDENIKNPIYMREDYYDDSVTVVTKGMELEFVRILTTFTIIDMSNNKFSGNIPKFIGNLSSLRGLNLSHNKLVGSIPPALGKLFVLESLDLSSNQLEGEIPQLLADIPWLAVLNLSNNHLVGRIPWGKQFNTFDNNSYNGNSALCGFPLSKYCGGDEPQHQPQPPKLEEEDDSDFWSGFTWKVVCLGYGCGAIFGLAMGYLMFKTGKPKWLVGLVENYEYKNGKKRGRPRRNPRRN